MSVLHQGSDSTPDPHEHPTLDAFIHDFNDWSGTIVVHKSRRQPRIGEQVILFEGDGDDFWDETAHMFGVVACILSVRQGTRPGIEDYFFYKTCAHCRCASCSQEDARFGPVTWNPATTTTTWIPNDGAV